MTNKKDCCKEDNFQEGLLLSFKKWKDFYPLGEDVLTRTLEADAVKYAKDYLKI
jgi:hypothetical protein